MTTISCISPSFQPQQVVDLINIENPPLYYSSKERIYKDDIPTKFSRLSISEEIELKEKPKGIKSDIEREKQRWSFITEEVPELRPFRIDLTKVTNKIKNKVKITNELELEVKNNKTITNDDINRGMNYILTTIKVIS